MIYFTISMTELVVVRSLTDVTGTDFTDGSQFCEIKPNWTYLDAAVSLIDECVYDQPEAALAVARASIRVKAGIAAGGRPEFVGLFLGAPGCGKTEMGRAIAQLYYGQNDWEKHFKLVSSSNFSSEHTITRLTGSPTGYIGWGDPAGLLITPEFLSDRNVIVFDEIEKSHRQFHRVLLRVLDEGKLEVALGTTAYENVKNVILDFSKSTIIFTSNIGSREIQDARSGRHRISIHHQTEERAVQSEALETLREYFAHMPEFLDRVPQENRIVFNPLTNEGLRKVFGKFIRQFNSQNETQHLIVTDALRDWILSQLPPTTGARNLRSKIEELLITPAALAWLALPKPLPMVAELDLDREVSPVLFKVQRSLLSQAERNRLVELCDAVVPGNGDHPNGNELKPPLDII